MNRLTRILCAVDFGPGSLSAARQAARIARWNQAGVEYIHVVASEVAAELEAVLARLGAGAPGGLLEDVQREWSRLGNEIPEIKDALLDTVVDHPVQALLERSRALPADLLVMGLHGTSRPGRGAGTVATACIRKTTCPVLLVQSGQDAAFRSVVACVDFSETSLEALRQATLMALRDGCRLHVLHVFNGPWHRLHYRAPTPEASPDFQRQYTDGLRGRLETFCQPLAAELGYLNPEYDVLDYPSYGDGIAAFINEHGCDLVALGTKGKSNIRYILWGRTAERVLRDAACSLLVVKPSAPPH